jgi:cbb3-type cytochrome oxidase subunit 3
MSAEMLAGTGVLRGVMAGVLLLSFLGIWLWAFSRRRRPAFEAAAHLPLEDDIPAGDTCEVDLR